MEHQHSAFAQVIKGGFARYAERVLDEILLDVDGYVYVIKGGGLYKIGRTKNPDARLSQLGGQLPFPVELITVIECEGHTKSEKALHALFAEKHRHGEWFDLDQGDVRWLRRIEHMVGPLPEVK